jgi:hypothetical protein
MWRSAVSATACLALTFRRSHLNSHAEAAVLSLIEGISIWTQAFKEKYLYLEQENDTITK